MGANRFEMSVEERYFFDLSGYLVVRSALTSDEVAECNAAIDHFSELVSTRSVDTGSLAGGSSVLKGTQGRKELTGMLGWPPPYREPFRRLLIHPAVVCRLNEMSGKGFRLDHGPLLIGAEAGAEGHQLHGAGEPFSQSVWYHQQNGRMYCRGVTVAWQLADVNKGDGGFCIVPGSHKTREPSPPGIRSVEDHMDLIEQPVMTAGDVLFFAETATHGTLPWRGGHERRSVLYKYASRAAARATGRHFTPETRWGDWVRDLNTEQRAVLYGPGVHTGPDFPRLDSDGETTRVV